MSGLAGKVALISGTGGGMGRAAALEFAAQGARVVGCDLNSDAAEETVAMVCEAGGEVGSAAPLDFTSEEDAAAWVDGALSDEKGIDDPGHNAAVARGGPWD